MRPNGLRRYGILEPYVFSLDRTQQKGTFEFVLKIQSEHRQMISCKFPQIFGGTRDLVVFYNFF